MVVVRGPSVGRGGLRCLLVRFEMVFQVLYGCFKSLYGVCQIVCGLCMGFLLVL